MENIYFQKFTALCYLLGVWKKPNGERVHVAVKQLKRSDRKELKNFEKEVKVLKMVDHENVVTLLGVNVEVSLSMKHIDPIIQK